MSIGRSSSISPDIYMDVPRVGCPSRPYRSNVLSGVSTVDVTFYHTGGTSFPGYSTTLDNSKTGFALESTVFMYSLIGGTFSPSHRTKSPISLSILRRDASVPRSQKQDFAVVDNAFHSQFVEDLGEVFVLLALGGTCGLRRELFWKPRDIVMR